MKRRDFITATALSASALAMNACHRPEEKEEDGTPIVKKTKKVTLKLATSWPAHFPIMGTGVDAFAKRCFELSGGTLEIKIFPKNLLNIDLQDFIQLILPIFHLQKKNKSRPSIFLQRFSCFLSKSANPKL